MSPVIAELRKLKKRPPKQVGASKNHIVVRLTPMEAIELAEIFADAIRAEDERWRDKLGNIRKRISLLVMMMAEVARAGEELRQKRSAYHKKRNEHSQKS